MADSSGKSPLLSRRQSLLVGLGAAAGVMTRSVDGRAAPSQVAIGEGIALSWAVFYVADQLQSWKDRGIIARPIMFPSGRHVMDAVAGNQVVMGTCAETPIVFANLNGIPMRVLGVMNVYDPFQLVASTAIQNPRDLRGKKVGYARGTNGHYYLSKLLKKYDLGFKDITAVNLSPTDFVTSLTNNSLDAFVWSEPMISAAVQNGGGKVHALSEPGLYKTYSSIITLQSTIDQQPEVLTSCLRALLDANTFIKNNTDRAKQITGDRLKLPAPDVNAGWPSPQLDSGEAMAEIGSVLTEQAQWAIESGLTRPDAKMVDFSKAVVPDLMSAAQKA